MFTLGFTATNKHARHQQTRATPTNTRDTRYTVRVKNIGAMDSDEVIQVYFVPQFVRTDAPTPHKQLIDFERVHVTAGGSTTVAFTVASSQFDLVDVNGTRAPHAGTYRLMFTNGVAATATVDVVVE
jgi:hypothetical protein